MHDMQLSSRSSENPQDGSTAVSRSLWAPLTFPPINLWNVWPTEEAADIHLQHFIKSWYGEKKQPPPPPTAMKIHEGAQRILNYAKGA